MKELRQRYGDQAEFLLVVVREANHAIPGLEFMLQEPVPQGPERRRLVARAMQTRGVDIPAVLDTDDAQVERAYAAWPLRLVVINTAGLVDFDAPFTSVGLNMRRVTAWFEFKFGQGRS